MLAIIVGIWPHESTRKGMTPFHGGSRFGLEFSVPCQSEIIASPSAGIDDLIVFSSTVFCNVSPQVLTLLFAMSCQTRKEGEIIKLSAWLTTKDSLAAEYSEFSSLSFTLRFLATRIYPQGDQSSMSLTNQPTRSQLPEGDIPVSDSPNQVLVSSSNSPPAPETVSPVVPSGGGWSESAHIEIRSRKAIPCVEEFCSSIALVTEELINHRTESALIPSHVIPIAS